MKTGIASYAAHFKNIRQMVARRILVLLLSLLRDNVHTASIASWKVRGRLPILDN